MPAKSRFLVGGVLGGLAALVLHAHTGCAPRASQPRNQIGPRLGESTARLPDDPSVAPPDAGGPTTISVPWNHPIPPTEPATNIPGPVEPAQPPPPTGETPVIVQPAPAPPDAF